MNETKLIIILRVISKLDAKYLSVYLKPLPDYNAWIKTHDFFPWHVNINKIVEFKIETHKTQFCLFLLCSINQQPFLQIILLLQSLRHEAKQYPYIYSFFIYTRRK
jgi:hypothetical protein